MVILESVSFKCAVGILVSGLLKILETVDSTLVAQKFDLFAFRILQLCLETVVISTNFNEFQKLDERATTK